jgi:hypothetical protein
VSRESSERRFGVEDRTMGEEGQAMGEEVQPEVVGGIEEEDLAAVREVVLRAYPDAVPELVGGGSVAEVLASVEPARAAYRRVVESVSAAGSGAISGPEGPSAPSVPAGAVGRPAVDPERLPAGEKIRRGLVAARRE